MADWSTFLDTLRLAKDNQLSFVLVRRLYLYVLLLTGVLCFTDTFSHADSLQREPSFAPKTKPPQIIYISPTGKNALNLQVETITQKRAPSTLIVPGKVELLPTLEFQQHALLSGRITDILVNMGDEVKKGQPLAMMESPELNRLAAESIQAAAQIRAEITQNAALLDDEVNQATSRHKLALAAYNRAKVLFDEKIAAKKTLEMALSEIEVADSRLTAVKKKRRLVLAALYEKLEVTLSPLRQRLKLVGLKESVIDKLMQEKHSVIDVPVLTTHCGTIVSIDLAIGQSVEPTVPLFTIADLSRLWIRANVYESDVAQIKKGQKVSVTLKSLPSQLFQGEISYVAPHIDPKLRTLSVCAELANADFKLKPGMYGEVHIETTGPHTIIVLPIDAVIQRAGKSIVYLEIKEGFHPVNIKTGRTFNHDIEIVEGLNPGQHVVVRGAYQIDAEAQKVTRQGIAPNPHSHEQEITRQSDEQQKTLKVSIQKLKHIYPLLISFILGAITCWSILWLITNRARLDSSKRHD